MKLKINKKVALIIGAAAFLFALGIMIMTSFQKDDEKSSTEGQLTTSQAKLLGINLDALSSQPAVLENQLNQLAPELEKAKAELSIPISSINATADVFEAARINGMVISEITSSSPTNENIKGVPLRAITINAIIEGKLTKMVNLISDLNNNLKTGTVKSVEIIVPEILASDNITVSTADNATANINLVIYTYRGE